MPIVVQYGPIAGALALASRAGIGQGYNIQAQRDLQTLSLQNQMQSEIDRRNASEMQNALAYDQLSAQNQWHQQSLAQADAMKQAQLDWQQQNATANRTLSQQQHDAQNAMQQAQLEERQNEFAQQQQTREQQAQELAKLRDAQIQKMQQPKDTTAQTIQANGAALRSLDQQSAMTQRQIQQLTAALGKASDPYTGSPEQAAALKEQINGLKFSLDGIDPSTGKKVRAGLDDQRTQLRQLLQQVGNGLGIKPTAVMKPSDIDPTKLDFINDPDNEGLDNPEDELYNINLPSRSGNGIMNYGNAQQPAAQTQSRGQATPAMILQVGQQIATQMGSSIADPRVRQAVRAYLSQQGFSIPTIQ